MREFRICGRIEHSGGARYRAVASAVPREAGVGPQVGDIHGQVFTDRTAAREALGLLAHSVARQVMARGDRVTGLDIR